MLPTEWVVVRVSPAPLQPLLSVSPHAFSLVHTFHHDTIHHVVIQAGGSYQSQVGAGSVLLDLLNYELNEIPNSGSFVTVTENGIIH